MMARATWRLVAELGLSEGTCARVRVLVLDVELTRQPGQNAWSAFILTRGDVLEVYVFAEDGDSELSAAWASAAGLDARDS